MSNLHVLLYIDGQTTPVIQDGTPVHWKSVVPKLDGTVITNFVVLAQQGAKRLFYCLVDTDSEMYAKARAFFLANKDAQGLKWWAAGSAREMWKEVFKDRGTDAVAAWAINNLIKYPVTVTEKDDAGKDVSVTKFVPVKDVASYGQTVSLAYYATANLDAILPHKFFDGSK
jgi:hypothetical protein